MSENTDAERARVIGELRKPVAWIGSGTGMSYLSVPVPIPTIFEAIRLLEADAGREARDECAICGAAVCRGAKLSLVCRDCVEPASPSPAQEGA